MTKITDEFGIPIDEDVNPMPKKKMSFCDWSIEQKEKYGMYGIDMLLWTGIFIMLITISVGIWRR